MGSIQENCIVSLYDNAVGVTMVTIGEVSREIYELAFEEVVGQPLREVADMTGRTERAILAATLELHGFSDRENKFDDFYVVLARAADKLCDRIARPDIGCLAPWRKLQRWRSATRCRPL